MAVLLWTYLPKESSQPLGDLFNYLLRSGHKVFTLDTLGELKRWDSNLRHVFRRMDGCSVLHTDLQRKWEPTIDAGLTPEDSRSASEKYAQLEDQAITILDWIRPNAVCVWNPMAPYFGVLGDVSMRRGVHCIYTERGVLPGTVVIDPDGLWRYARYRIGNADPINTKQAYSISSEIFRDLDPSKTVRYSGLEASQEDLNFLKQHEGKPIVAIFESPPHEHSITAEARLAGISGLPVADDYNEMLTYLLDALPDFAFIFKPHPHSHKIRISKSTGVLVTEMHPLKLLNLVSVVITNGSKLEMTSYLMKKRLILAGNGLFWNTGAAKDCHTLSEIVEALKETQRTPSGSPVENISFLEQFGSYASSRLLFFKDRDSDIRILQGEIPFFRMRRTSFIHSAGMNVRMGIGSIRHRLAYLMTVYHGSSALEIINRVSSAFGNRAKNKFKTLKARYLFWKTFHGKRVCLVGNAAAIEGLSLGHAIDDCDIVIRFNVALIAEREKTVGTRTDIRFVGVTLHEGWRSPFAEVPASDPLWTFDKNSAYLRSIRRAFLAVPTEWHHAALPLFLRRYPEVYMEPLPLRPPRSGVAFLLLLLLYGRPREVVLHGFSQHTDQAYEAMYRARDKRQEDVERLAQAHCDPSVEIVILQKLRDIGILTFGST